MYKFSLRIMLGSLIAFAAATPILAQSPTRAQLETEIVAFRAKLVAKEQAAGFGDTELRTQLRSKEEAFLLPDAQDLVGFAASPGVADSGVIRLMPREKYERILRMRGGGSYYSFIRLTHEYGYGSDIELMQGKFSVGFAGADFGFIAELGNVPLDTVTLTSAGVPALAGYTPPLMEPDARVEQKRFGQSFSQGTLTYRNRVAAQVGQTYALRAIGYEHTDVLVAFRVLRQDLDGSLILSWKLLRRYPAPPLERAPVPATATSPKAE